MEDWWMALGLAESKNMNGIIEEGATAYFKELVSRSFFEMFHPAQYFEALLKDATDPARSLANIYQLDLAWSFSEIAGVFQVHELMHDLGRYVAGEETAFVSFDTNQVSTRAKHLVWTEENRFEREFPSQLLTAIKARSFLLKSDKGVHMSTSFLHSFISNFRCLRILSLTGFEFEELPNSIGDSKHLRLLNLTNNGKLKRLPDSISKLVNLQTLSITGCMQLEIFPKKLHKWISLRCLYFTSKLDSCLETCYHGWTSMRKIVIYACAYLTSLLEELGALTTLQFLYILNCPNLASLPNSIKLLTALEHLEIQHCEKLNLSGWQGLNGLRSLRVLMFTLLPLMKHFPDGLQHCTSLLKLMIAGCHNLSTLPGGIETLNSLKTLLMTGISPILESRCEREKGED